MSGLPFGLNYQLQSSMSIGRTKECQAASMNLVWPSIDLEMECMCGLALPFELFKLLVAALAHLLLSGFVGKVT